MLQQIQLNISGSFSVRENEWNTRSFSRYIMEKEKQNTEHKPFAILQKAFTT